MAHVTDYPFLVFAISPLCPVVVGRDRELAPAKVAKAR